MEPPESNSNGPAASDGARSNSQSKNSPEAASAPHSPLPPPASSAPEYRTGSPIQSSKHRPAQGASAIWQVTTQELRSSLRDRQTVMNSVVLPIVMYPIMFWVIMQGFLVVQGHKERTQVEIALVGDTEQVEALRDDFETLVADADPMPEDADSESGSNARVLFRTDLGAELNGDFSDEALKEVLSEEYKKRGLKQPDAILRLPSREDASDGPSAGNLPEDPSNQSSAEKAPVATLFLESTRSDSELASERIGKLARKMSSDLRLKEANDRGLSKAQLDPIDIHSHAITAERDQGAFVLSLFLPMMIVFMAVMGAFFPAVDSTAGEKERGTSETTLLIPIPRDHVLLGKILATTALSFAATILNLTFMGLAARHLFGTLGPKVPFTIEFPFLALLYSLPLVLLFCFFVSAVMTALAGLTKSFKEGQAMLGPAQMVFILPAIIGVMPGLKLSLAWALVPVVNVVLAVRSILLMEWLPLPYLLTCVVLLASAWIAVRICVRILSQEALSFANSSMSLKELLRKTRNAKS